MSSKTRVSVVAILVLIAISVWWYRSQVYNPPGPLVAHPRLALVTGGSSPYWQLLCKGAEAAADNLGAKLQLLSPKSDEDPQEQTDLLLTIDPDEVDGVALSPLDAQQQTRLINDLAVDALVITVDSDAPLSNRMGFVGASNYAAGRQCAELVQEALADGGKVVVLAANMTKHNMVERMQGIEERFAGAAGDDNGAPAIEVVEVLIDEGNSQRCQQQLAELIDANPDIAGVVGLNSYHGALIVQSLEQKGLIGKLKVVAFDAVDDTLDAIEQDAIYATVAQDPYQYGYEAVSRLVANCQRTGPQLPLVGAKSTMNISTRKLYKADLQEYRRQYDQRLGGSAPATKAPAASKPEDEASAAEVSAE